MQSTRPSFVARGRNEAFYFSRMFFITSYLPIIFNAWLFQENCLEPYLQLLNLSFLEWQHPQMMHKQAGMEKLDP